MILEKAPCRGVVTEYFPYFFSCILTLFTFFVGMLGTVDSSVSVRSLGMSGPCFYFQDIVLSLCNYPRNHVAVFQYGQNSVLLVRPDGRNYGNIIWKIKGLQKF